MVPVDDCFNGYCKNGSQWLSIMFAVDINVSWWTKVVTFFFALDESKASMLTCCRPAWDSAFAWWSQQRNAWHYINAPGMEVYNEQFHTHTMPSKRCVEVAEQKQLVVFGTWCNLWRASLCKQELSSLKKASFMKCSQFCRGRGEPILTIYIS